MRLDRRRFLLVAGFATGGFLVGCTDRERQQLDASNLPLADGEIALNGWVKVSTAGLVTVMMPRSEMGQGVHTGLMMLVAEEMDCGWAQMRMENAPVDRLYGAVVSMGEGIPFRPDDEGLIARSMRWSMTEVGRELGLMVTGGSASVRDLWLPLRTAAAVTRASLIEAAARARGVDAESLTVREGQILEGEKPLMTLGEAVALLTENPVPATRYALKSAADFRLIGQPLPRIDAASKVAGTAVFGLDVKPEGLLHTAIRFAPARGAGVATLDESAARALPGVAGVVKLAPVHGGTGGVAVVATQYWQARKALDALEVTFDDGPLGGFSTSGGLDTLRGALADDNGFAFWKTGDVETALESAKTRIDASYEAPWLAHTPMEPMNCTVRYAGERATVWAPTQVPGLVRKAVADILELAPEAVDVEVTLLGGGFGRRLEVDVAAQAAQIAKGFPGQPVKLIWSREDDVRHDFYRPACVARFEAGLDSAGQLVAWRNTSAGQSITAGFLARNVGMPGMGPDKSASEGAYDQAYEFPNVRVGHVDVELPVPVGYWRSVGHSHQAFFKESFLDECAHAAAVDPLAFRLGLLKEHPREHALLQRVAQAADWDAAQQAGGARALGIALHESFGTRVAMVVELFRDAGTIRLSRVVVAVDCGQPVNPNLIAQQVESSVVYGLSAALGGRIEFEDGRVVQENFHDYPALALRDCPRIETHLMNSTEPPGGIGEPALPPVAPALANALYVLTGRRVRALPFSLNEEMRA